MKKSRLLQSDKFWGSLAALLVLLQFWWLPGEGGSAADSYSSTMDGRLGLYRLLTELFPLVSRDARRCVPEDPSTLILIAPDRLPTREEQMELYEFVYSGGELVFAPSPAEVDVEFDYLGIRVERHVPTRDMNALIDSVNSESTPAERDATPAPEVVATPLNAGADPDVVELEAPQDSEGNVEVTGTLSSEGVVYRSNTKVSDRNSYSRETLVEAFDGSVQAAGWSLGRGRVVVCAGADLFSNRSLLTPANRRLAVRLVENARKRLGESLNSELPIVMSEYFNASDSYQQAGALFSPGLRAGSLQLLLVAVLGIWLAFHRFGPVQNAESVQRRTLTESARAVGNLQFRVRDGGTVVKTYVEYVQSRLRNQFGRQVRLEDPVSVASRTDLEQKEVTEQLRSAHALATTRNVPSVKAAAMVRWLSMMQSKLSGTSED